MKSQNLYPPSPSFNDASYLVPHQSFKENAYKVIGGIVLFVLVYLSLLALSLLLLVFSFMAGGFLLMAKVHWITLVIAAGLICLGGMFFIFPIKFIFARRVQENPMAVEIKENHEPELFAFIRKLTQDTQTPFPKKIFLTPDVNASVFYNSSFWSMFFPVRKNLNIGLGLVNSLNISEFKAVLAHEFGHFSQKSMKLGSYVYTVNKALYDMVYSYDNWDDLLQKWANVGGVFGWFAIITFWFVKQVRYILSKAYSLINKLYLSLSREMEFHADRVAVSVTSNEAMISALRKIDFTSQCYDLVSNYIERFYFTKRYSTDNLYQNHLSVIAYFSKQLAIKLDTHGQPLITNEDLHKKSKSRVMIQDQWASHPSNEEREVNINQVEIKGERLDLPAWALFENAEDLQRKFTKRLYNFYDIQEKKSARSGETLNPTQELAATDFYLEMEKEKEENALPEQFHDFYSQRQFAEFDIEAALSQTENSTDTFENLYSTNHKEKFDFWRSNQDDLATLHQIAAGYIDAKTFDFDGVKYNKSQVEQVIETLTKEVETQNAWVNEIDQRAFIFNYKRVKAQQPQQKEVFVNYYKNIFALQKTFEEYDVFYQKYHQARYEMSMVGIWQEENVKKLISTLMGLENSYQKQLNTFADFMIKNEEVHQYKAEYAAKSIYSLPSYDFQEDKFENFVFLVETSYIDLQSIFKTEIKNLLDFQASLTR